MSKKCQKTPFFTTFCQIMTLFPIFTTLAFFSDTFSTKFPRKKHRIWRIMHFLPRRNFPKNPEFPNLPNFPKKPSKISLISSILAVNAHFVPPEFRGNFGEFSGNFFAFSGICVTRPENHPIFRLKIIDFGAECTIYLSDFRHVFGKFTNFPENVSDIVGTTSS